MKKISRMVVVLIIITLITACGLNTGTKTFKSFNNLYQLNTSSTWTEASPGSLNKNAELELKGLRIDKYAMILTDNASNFKDYKEWLNIVITNNANTYGFEASQLKDIELDGTASKYVEFNTEVQNDDQYDVEHPTIPMYMRVYFINGKNYYSQLFMWTMQENKATVSPEFDEMINSLKILK